MSEKLMPCPFCGGERIAKHPLANMMVCAGCGVAGPDAVNREVASLAWNTRAQGAAPTGEIVAWGMRFDGGQILDCISPEEHAREEGGYTVPLCIAAPSNAEGPKPDGQDTPLTEKEAATFVNVRTVWSDFAGHFVVDGFGLIRDVEAHHGILPPAPPSSSQEGAGIEDQHDRIMGPLGRFR